MIFISYCQKDIDPKEEDSYLKLFIKYLKGASEPEFFENNVWYDGKIKTGADWQRELDERVNSTTIAVLFVSANYLASDFIRQKELGPFLLKGGIHICWFLIDECSYKIRGLGKFQAANKMDSKRLMPFQEMTDLNEIKKILHRSAEQVYDLLKKKLIQILRK